MKEKEKEEKMKQKKKIKKGSKVEEEEKKEGKEKLEKENDEGKEGNAKEEEEENKQKEKKQEKVLSKKKGLKKEEKTKKDIKATSPFLGKKRKIKRKRKEEKEDFFKKEEKIFEKKLLAVKNEIGEGDTESEINLINIEPISEYVKKKKEEWNKNKSSEDFSMEKFAKTISIIQDFNYEFLNTMINRDLEKCIQYYKFYQFTLTASQRQEIQNKIKDKCDLPIIKNNFIPESIKDIKVIFVKLCNSIVKIDCYQKDFLETLKKTFIENYV